jgi:hypothetical protein
MLVSFYQTTPCHIPEGNNLHSRQHENVRFQTENCAMKSVLTFIWVLWKTLCHMMPVIVAALLLESVMSDRTPQHCSRAGQTVRQRKFPGPAGLLPDTVGDARGSVMKLLRSLFSVMWHRIVWWMGTNVRGEHAVSSRKVEKWENGDSMIL